jgi:CheY-like chemotaxis protein/HPt (histidine-containing phosphotransfer) domain-containing protein
MMGGEIGLESEVGRGSTFWFTARLEEASEPLGPAVLPSQGGRVPRRGRILVVEDNVVNQMVTTSLLQKQGCQVDVACSGGEAVQAVARIPYDLVLMDCQMPEMDGYQATQRIRQQEGPGQRVPIVALTASAQQSDRERCLAAGMDGYLSKPIRVADLAAALDRWLPRTSPEPGAAPVQPAPLAGPLDPEMLEQVRQATGERFPELLDFFLETTPPRVTALRAALASGDQEALQRTAHTLAGSVGNLGALQLCALFRRLETLPGGEAAAALELVAQAEAEYARVHQALAALAREPPAGRS